jgi:hypothetical protein
VGGVPSLQAPVQAGAFFLRQSTHCARGTFTKEDPPLAVTPLQMNTVTQQNTARVAQTAAALSLEEQGRVRRNAVASFWTG